MRAVQLEELNFQFYFILINCNLSNHMGFLATILDSTDPNQEIRLARVGEGGEGS
jgi:hypothetical protein